MSPPVLAERIPGSLRNAPVIEYRPFRNDDPPHIVRLWNSAGLGRGAASNVSADAFDLVCFSHPYFDRHGLIVAVKGETPVGFAHAGFAFLEDGSGLDPRHGVICVVVVDPGHRRQGIGRELVRRAEEFLKGAGASRITAGPSPGRDPFYVGMYGGIEPAGFLDSDAAASPFFQRLGYAPGARHLVFQRPIPGPADPVHFRLIGIRRKMELVGTMQPLDLTWAWATRYGRLDSLEFQLTPKGKGASMAVARATLVGLDLYLATWQERAVGLLGMYVPDAERRKGYGQALLLDIGRKLRNEMITCVEMHAPESNAAACALLSKSGFHQVDAGTEFVRA